jgi:hypothetical protein
MDGPTALVGIGDGLGGVHGGLGAFELIPVVDDRTGLLEPAAELIGSRIDGGIGRRRPAADHPPQPGEADRGSAGQERKAAVHEADATLVAASCLAPRRLPNAPGRGQAA